MSHRTRVRAVTWCKRLAVLQVLLVTGCSAPDYTPVREWAATASLVADYPAIAVGGVAEPVRVVPPSPSFVPMGSDQNVTSAARAADGILAMQEALVTYLAALATLASDGVLPYRDDPFVQLAVRAAQTGETGCTTVTALGSLLRRSSISNARAPATRDTIVAADGFVQTLITAISDAIAATMPMEARARMDVAGYYSRVESQAREPAARQAVRDSAVLYDREFAARAAARIQYGFVLTRIAEGHALLKARVRTMTQEDTARLIRGQVDRLQRASGLLPRAPAARHQTGVGLNPGRPGECSNVGITATSTTDRILEAAR